MYFYLYIDKGLMMCAIPDLFWSIEFQMNTDIKDIHEELLMHFFNFYSENEANRLAQYISDWIATNLKENDE